MSNRLDLCPGCFQEPRVDAPCPRCRYQHDPDAFPSALLPGTELAKYMLGRVLGKPGGFGITYLAFDPVLHRRLAIKELMPRDLVARRPDGATLHVHTREDAETFRYTLASFLKEARLLAQFNHPNVVRVLDYFEANGTAYFAMEYYEGQTLGEYTDRGAGRLSGPEAVSLMLPLLDALDHIHTLPEPTLHRDIKPANIYLTGKQTPILLDFGAARVAMGQQSRSLSAVLTPGFAPYEQYSTRGNQGPWSDVYGCAATLHYLVTGRVPPEASERVDDPRIESPRTFAPELTQELSDAIVAGLGFKPQDRPQSARAFADLIQGREGRERLPLPATERLPRYADVGMSGTVDLSRTVKLPVTPPRQALGATEIAPPSSRPPVLPPPVPPSQAPASSQVRRSRSRMPLMAGIAALALIAVTVYTAILPGKATPEDGKESLVERTDPPPRESPSPRPDRPIVSDPRTTPGDPNIAPQPDPKTDIPVPPKTRQPPTTPGRGDTTTGGGTTAQRDDPPPPPARPPTAVLVVIRGDDADGVRQAETSILRSLVGRGGLQALDSNSLSMLKGDQSAVQAATLGNFADLAAIARPQGVELMVVGELRAHAAPSINRFFTGTAELSVKMYRVSTSRLVEAQTFIVGQGGTQAVLATSDGEARSRAASAAADAAADGVGSWLGRAF